MDRRDFMKGAAAAGVALTISSVVVKPLPQLPSPPAEPAYEYLPGVSEEIVLRFYLHGDRIWSVADKVPVVSESGVTIFLPHPQTLQYKWESEHPLEFNCIKVYLPDIDHEVDLNLPVYDVVRLTKGNMLTLESAAPGLMRMVA